MLSNLSNIPPWPGIIKPKSFMPVILLILEAVKSPSWATMDPKKDNKTKFHKGNSSKYLAKIRVNRAVPNIPPTEPSTVLLGLNLGQSLVFPNKLPDIYAKVSVPHAVIKTNHIYIVPSKYIICWIRKGM